MRNFFRERLKIEGFPTLEASISYPIDVLYTVISVHIPKSRVKYSMPGLQRIRVCAHRHKTYDPLIGQYRIATIKTRTTSRVANLFSMARARRASSHSWRRHDLAACSESLLRQPCNVVSNKSETFKLIQAAKGTNLSPTDHTVHFKH